MELAVERRAGQPERDPDHVLRDVRDEKVSVQHAREA